MNYIIHTYQLTRLRAIKITNNRTINELWKRFIGTFVIGGGYAGLSTSFTLQKHNKKFVLLEAMERAGGRAFEQIIGEDFHLEPLCRRTSGT